MAKSSRKWIPVERVPKFGLRLILTSDKYKLTWFGKFGVHGYDAEDNSQQYPEPTHYIIDPDMPEEATTDE